MDVKTVKSMISGALNGLRDAFSATVVSGKNGTENQTYKVTGLAGEDLPDVELFQHFGFSSKLPAGTQVVALPLGGKTAHAILIASENGGVRIKGLQDGETVMFSAEGAYVKIKKGKIVEVSCDDFILNASKSVTITSPTVAIAASATATIATPQMGFEADAMSSTGNFEVRGTMHADGDISTDADTVTSGKSFLNHVHNESIGSQTAPPT